MPFNPNQNPAIQGLAQAAGGGPVPTIQFTPDPTPGGPGVMAQGYPVNPQWTDFFQALNKAGVNKIKGFSGSPTMPAVTGLQNSLQNNLNQTAYDASPMQSY